LVHEVSLSLLRLATSASLQRKQGSLSDAALSRAREFLDANCLRVVSSTELERVCGHTRFAISTAFRQRFGTSPHRYLLMRRLEVVRSQLPTAPSIAALAGDAAFADQAHMTRMFRQAFGMTPGAYAGLRCAGRLTRGRPDSSAGPTKEAWTHSPASSGSRPAGVGCLTR
jgi:AraC-like DNA-binding protein